MKQPPYMITAKDRLYLEDLLNHTLTSAKKINHYRTLAKNQALIALLEDVENLLTAHYDDLLMIMEG